jgi:flagellar motor switch protein FliM
MAESAVTAGSSAAERGIGIEEARALAGSAAGAKPRNERAGERFQDRGVAPRDFHVPHKLGAARRGELAALVQKALPELQERLLGLLRQECELTLTSLREISSEGLAGELPQPLAAARFECGSQPAWIAWQVDAAVAVIERILGAAAPGEKARDLSALERGILARIFGALAAGIGQALATQAGPAVVAVQPEDLGSWRDGGAGSDPHRLAVDLTVEIGGRASPMHLYLPGFHRQDAARAATAARELPGHLGPIDLSLSVELGEAMVPLAELLRLEVGDVLVLEAASGAPVRVVAEGVVCAQAALGRRAERYAARLIAAPQLTRP